MRTNKVLLFVCLAAIIFPTIVLPDCGKEFARPMLASNYHAQNNLLRFSTAEKEFTKAFQKHSASDRYASQAAVAFVALEPITQDPEKLFERIVTLAAYIDIVEFDAQSWYAIQQEDGEEIARELKAIYEILSDSNNSRRYVSDWENEERQREQEVLAAQIEVDRLDELERQKIQEWQREEREKIGAIQKDLNLIGYSLNVDGKLGRMTASALADFQDNEKLSINGEPTMETIQALVRSVETAKDEIHRLNVFLTGEDSQEISDLRNELGLTGEYLFNEEVRSLAILKLRPRLKESRKQFNRLGYSTPLSDDPLAWQQVISDFQNTYHIDEDPQGLMGRATRNELNSLYSLALETEEIPNDVNSWKIVSGSQGPPGPIPTGLDESTKFFLVHPKLAEHIAHMLNDALGYEAIVTGGRLPDQQNDRVAIAVVDTRNIGLSDVVAEFVRIDKIGAGLATSEGIVLFATSINGKTILQSSSNGRSEFTLVNSFWDRLWRVMDKTPAVYTSPKSLIRRKIEGAEFVLAEGEAMDQIPLEAVIRVPVIRSAISGRGPDEIVALVDKALSKKMRKSNTTYFSGLPKDEVEYFQLKNQTGLVGEYSESWAAPNANIISTLKKNGYNGARKDIANKMRTALSKRDNVIIVVAHQTKNTLYFPGKDGLIEIKAEDLEVARESIKKNSPTVLLISCETAPVVGQKSKFGSKLIELGAGLVIAPTRRITPFETEELLSELFKNSKNESLLKATLRAMKIENLIGSDPTVKFYVHNSK